MPLAVSPTGPQHLGVRELEQGGGAPDPTMVVPARLTRSMVAALDELLAERQRENLAITRQDILRTAVARYLAAAKRKGGRRESDG